MDKYNVIVPTNNLEELNADILKWGYMPFDLRKKSDDECIRMYGCTNKDLYEKLKADILFKNKEDDTIQESQLITKYFNYDNLDDLINYSHEVQQSPFIVIIDPTISTIDDLNERMNSYLALSDKDKRLSDSYSLKIWGYNAMNLYNMVKDSIETSDAKEDIDDKSNLLTEGYKEQCLYSIIEEKAIENIFEGKLIEADLLIHNILNDKSIYANRVACKLNENSNLYNDTDSSILPDICPWLTADDMRRNKLNFEAEGFTYRNLTNCEDDELTKYGWTKYYKPNLESLKEAKERFAGHNTASIINTDIVYQYAVEPVKEGYCYDSCPIIFVFNYDNGMDNLLSYNKVGIMIDKDIYTFNGTEYFKGFTKENLDNYNEIQLYIIYVSEKIYDKINSFILNGGNEIRYDYTSMYNKIIMGIKNPHTLDAIKIAIMKYVHLLASIAEGFTDKYIQTNKIYKVYSGPSAAYNNDNIIKILDVLSNDTNRDACIQNIIDDTIKEATDDTKKWLKDYLTPLPIIE